MNPAFRKPQRITITVSNHLYLNLIRYADEQGRSVSNYAAFLLESGLERHQAIAPMVSRGEPATGAKGLL